jgi:2-octaprenylphenol hydroxylase
MKIHYDLVISGGGIVGLCLAYRLKNTGLKIALIEPHPPTQHKSTKVSAINRKTIHTLSDILPAFEKIDKGVYEKIAIYLANPSQKIFPAIHFNAQDIDENDLGWIVFDDEVRYLLWQALQESTVTFFSSVLSTITENTDEILLTLDNAIIHTRYLVIAEGLQSRAASLLQLSHDEKAYPQMAITATLQLSLPHHNTAAQYFQEDSILAFLPLSHPNEVSMVLSFPTKKIDDLLSLSPHALEIYLAEFTNSQQGSIQIKSVLKTFPLQKKNLHHYVKNKIIFVGDAAHRLHPMAGQGLNIGLEGAMRLADVFNCRDALHASHQSLKHWERREKFIALEWYSIFEVLLKLFPKTADKKTYSMVQQGFTWIDKMAFVKKWIMRRAG